MQLAVLFVPCAFSRTQGPLCKAPEGALPSRMHTAFLLLLLLKLAAQRLPLYYADNQLSPARTEKIQALGALTKSATHFSKMGFSGLTEDMETQPHVACVSCPPPISHRGSTPLPCIHSGLLPTVDLGPICDCLHQKNKEVLRITGGKKWPPRWLSG